MLTAHDPPIVAWVEAGGVDMILVGDSAADNHTGHDDTLPLTMPGALEHRDGRPRRRARCPRVEETEFVVGL